MIQDVMVLAESGVTAEDRLAASPAAAQAAS
jgi:hypothetical protein